jgi:hypothetical protein
MIRLMFVRVRLVDKSLCRIGTTQDNNAAAREISSLFFVRRRALTRQKLADTSAIGLGRHMLELMKYIDLIFFALSNTT